MMKTARKMIGLILALALCCGMVGSAAALTFTDAHGNEIELDETLEAYSCVTLYGADNAARKGETNLGDLWADALRWFAVSEEINLFFEEDDVAAGITAIDADPDHIVALWNGGNLRADIQEGKFGAEQLAEVLPYPNKVAVVYMTGAQLAEALEAASQGLPYTEEMLEDEAHPQYRLLASLVRLQPVDREAFIDALEATKTEYVVLSKGNPRDTFLMSAGLKKIAETESHAVYRYEVKEPYDFELVDYSVVY